MSTFYDEVQELKSRYPDWRSATLPALQLAQEKHDYLSPDALRETAAALGTTPAFCESVASFYDMLHLRPVGRHIVEVCTNLPCALAGAQRVVGALEERLGVAAGETTEDGEITFRTVECLGGCGYATVVAVDERYHQFMTPEKVPELLEELRAS
jgi:NADH-quinone oxidoreductase subunit E